MIVMFRVLCRLKEIHVREEELKHKVEISGEGYIVPIIADEDIKIKKNEVYPVRIKKINIPPKAMILICPYAKNRHGHVIAVGEEIPLPLDVERCLDIATFLAVLDGEIKKGDVLASLIILPAKSVNKL